MYFLVSFSSPYFHVVVGINVFAWLIEEWTKILRFSVGVSCDKYKKLASTSFSLWCCCWKVGVDLMCVRC